MPKTDTHPMRCGAYARQTGQPCKSWGMANGRCRMHGGRSTGARKPRVTHGRRTKQAIAERKASAALMRAAKKLLKNA